MLQRCLAREAQLRQASPFFGKVGFTIPDSVHNDLHDAPSDPLYACQRFLALGLL